MAANISGDPTGAFPDNEAANYQGQPNSVDQNAPSSSALGYTPSGKPRLYQCSVCLRSFARLEHLKRHERSHTKEKPFNCGVCGRKFSRRDLLLRHAEKLHGGCSEAVRRLRRRRRSTKKVGTSDSLGANGNNAGADGSSVIPNNLDMVSMNRNAYSNINRGSAKGMSIDNGPPMSTFINTNKRKDLSSMDTSASGTVGDFSDKLKIDSLFSKIITKQADRSEPFDASSEGDARSLKRMRRASFSASSGENYAMPKYFQYDPIFNTDSFSSSNNNINQTNGNNNSNSNSNNGNNNNSTNGGNLDFLNNQTSYLYADSVEFSTPQFVPDELDNAKYKGDKNSLKLQDIPELSLNEGPNNRNNQFSFSNPEQNNDEHEIKRINNFVYDLHLNKNIEKAKMNGNGVKIESATGESQENCDNTNKNDKKDSPMYGDYNIYGVESPDAEDWVNKVLENSQIDFLSGLKDNSTNFNKLKMDAIRNAAANQGSYSKKIDAFQNQLSKLSSDDSSTYSHTKNQNSPNETPGLDSKQTSNTTNKDPDIKMMQNSLYGYSFYTDEMSNTNSNEGLNPMDKKLRNSFGVYDNLSELEKPSKGKEKSQDSPNEFTANVDKSRSQEVYEEYDLISELNNMQNFQFFLDKPTSSANQGTSSTLKNGESPDNDRASKSKTNQWGVGAQQSVNGKKNVISMDRNDSGKSTNSTQTMISSGSSANDHHFGINIHNKILEGHNVNASNNGVTGANNGANQNPYFKHFNNISNGYSYYGVNVPMGLSSSEISVSNISGSALNNISPSLLDNKNTGTNLSQQNDGLTKIVGNNSSHNDNPSQFLFTKHLRECIHSTLMKYPFIGIPSPTIVNNTKLNEYVKHFNNKFSNHLPFVHEFYLNEVNMDRLTSFFWEPSILSNFNKLTISTASNVLADEKNAAMVCLPLLVATLGAIVSNDKKEASNLYEASRRCIHVYLDIRKKNYGSKGKNSGLTSAAASPLWLLQSLTLSVIYGLFAEFDLSSEIILKQVKALIALIRSSNLNSLRFDPNDYEDILTEKSGNKLEEYYLIYESKVRTIYTIFNVSNLLNYFYGLKVEKLLKVEEMNLNFPIHESNFTQLNTNFDIKNGSLLNINVEPDTEKFNDFFSHMLENKKFKSFNISEYGLLSLEFGINQYLTDLSESEEKEGDLKLLRKWIKNIAKIVPKNLNKNNETFFDSSTNLLKVDSLIMSHYLMFKFYNKNYLSLNEIKNLGIWSKNWRKIGKLLFKPSNFTTTDNEEILGLKYGVKILIDLFFIKDSYGFLGSTNNLENFISKSRGKGKGVKKGTKKFDEDAEMHDNSRFGEFKNKTNGTDGNMDIDEPDAEDDEDVEDDEDDEDFESIFEFDLLDNMISKSSMSKLLSLNLQLLFDVTLVLTKFAFTFERKCIERDEEGNSSTKLAPNNYNRNDIYKFINNETLMTEIKFYKLILKIFNKLEDFLIQNYNYDPKANFSKYKNLDTSYNQNVSKSLLNRYTTSLKILKLSEFMFSTVFDTEIGFNIFKNLSYGLYNLYDYLIVEIQSFK